jgi:hypothetical protein
MKNFLFITFLTFVLVSCHEDPQFSLNISKESNFNGTFQAMHSDKVSGLAALQIFNGHYECTTSLPFGRGAGKIKVWGNSITFMDTTSFIIPAIYGPAYQLSGTYTYEFDGNHLKVWRKKNAGVIVYDLDLDN